MDKVLEELRYGGRTLEVRVYVNTDEEAIDVARRVQMLLAGEQDNAAVASAQELPKETAAKLWEAIFEQAKRQEIPL